MRLRGIVLAITLLALATAIFASRERTVAGYATTFAVAFAVLLVLIGTFRATVVWWNVSRAAGPTIARRGDGSFDWYPAGQEPGTRPIGGVPRFRYDWEDADEGGLVAARFRFDVPDRTPQRAIDRALRSGLRLAAWRSPGRAKVRAKGAIVDVPGPDTRISVRLEIRGFGITQEKGEVVAEAFARGFLARLPSGTRV